MLCSTCRKLASSALRQDFNSWNTLDQDVNNSIEIPFNDHDGVKKSYRLGCEFCGFFLPFFEAYKDDIYHGQETHFAISCSFAKTDADRPKFEFGLWACATWGTFRNLCQFEICRPPSNEARVDWNTDQSGLPQMPSKRPDSAYCVSLVKHWLEQCKNTHDECRSANHSLPTRLLDVAHQDDSESIRLIRGNAVEGEYVTLSYCWGRDQHLTTTRATLQHHDKGIALDSLPRTIRDAVSVTRSLGLRYLWVDALCIIQDDDEDWAREAANMCAVYEHAALSLSILDSPSSDSGFLKDREEENFTLSDVDGEPVALRQWQGHRSARVLHSGQILETRAWTLQERVLAPTILHFEARQLHWECSHGIASESHREIYDAVVAESDSYYGRSVHDTKKLIRDENGGTTLRAWHELVENYMTRQLTKPSDRLSALQGLATKFQRSNKGYYVFGLWSSEIHLSLLWFASSSGKDRPLRDPSTPSWSWASLEVPITFRLKANNDRGAFTPRARIDIIKNDGVLQVRGSYQSGFCIRTTKHGTHCTFATLTSRNLFDTLKAELDYIDDSVPKDKLVERDLYCLLIGELILDDIVEKYYLILEPGAKAEEVTSNAPRTFKRAGVAWQEVWKNHGTGVLSSLNEDHSPYTTIEGLLHLI